VGALVAGFCIFTWIFSLIMVPVATNAPERLEEIRRLGPLALLLLCFLNLISSSAERAVIPFTPAEVDFLFAGPFSRRQLLSYKLMITLFSCVAGAAFFVLGFSYLRVSSVPLVARFVGFILAIFFMQLLTIVLVFLASTIGARAYNRVRKLILLFLAAVVLAGLFHVGGELFRLPPRELMARLEQTSVVQVCLEPFRWFVLTFTAENVWPDLMKWGSLSLAVDLVLVFLVFALDAQYLENAAAASERVYAQVQRLRTGGAAAVPLHGKGKPRFSLPSLPWWGGIGPLAWRQMMRVPRSRSVLALLILLCPLAVMAALPGSQEQPDGKAKIILGLGGQVIALTIFLTSLVAFDFRSDVDRMDVLKALPVAPIPLVIGQLLTPVMFLSVIQWIAMGLIMVSIGRPDVGFGTAIPFVVPFNFLLIGIDNLMFLLFPVRTMTVTVGDFQALGRQLLLNLLKFLVLGLATGLAAVVALPFYFLAGQSLGAALIAGWIVLAGCGASLVPFLAMAFRRYDVARDTPA
jgi:hypothetical protein